MADTLTITVLGCGASGGVPLIGCHCAICTCKDARNTRTRSSILMESNNKTILVDTSPDLRQQALREGIATVDAILFTHDHADHLHGLDDARSFNFHRKGSIPVYGDAETIKGVTERFSYAFGAPAGPDGIWMKPSLQPEIIEDYAEIRLGDLTIQSFLQYHGKGKSLGYRVGNFAYSPDVDNFPEKSLQVLEKLDVWLVDCLRYTPSATHAHLEKTLGWIETLKPKLSILTHMAHEFDYDSLRRQLPPNVIPAFDGMKITLGDPIEIPGFFPE